ncbi:MAG TPA: hypothetical protein PK766_09895 [Bacteroidales bacterium]|nr:hypothetical protein [Bacteroidales bacterium]
MKRVLIIVFTVLSLILFVNVIYYSNFYKKQINYITNLLDRQVQIVGLSVDNTNLNFLSDLNRISFTDDLVRFFTDPQNERRAIENMKLFYSKYQDFITGIRIFDNKKNEFTLRKDEEWLDQKFITNLQNEIVNPEGLFFNNKRYNISFLFFPIMRLWATLLYQLISRNISMHYSLSSTLLTTSGSGC